jgi:hypothetical protein
MQGCPKLTVTFYLHLALFVLLHVYSACGVWGGGSVTFGHPCIFGHLTDTIRKPTCKTVLKMRTDKDHCKSSRHYGVL